MESRCIDRGDRISHCEGPRLITLSAATNSLCRKRLICPNGILKNSKEDWFGQISYRLRAIAHTKGLCENGTPMWVSESRPLLS